MRRIVECCISSHCNPQFSNLPKVLFSECARLGESSACLLLSFRLLTLLARSLSQVSPCCYFAFTLASQAAAHSRAITSSYVHAHPSLLDARPRCSHTHAHTHTPHTHTGRCKGGGQDDTQPPIFAFISILGTSRLYGRGGEPDQRAPLRGISAGIFIVTLIPLPLSLYRVCVCVGLCSGACGSRGTSSTGCDQDPSANLAPFLAPRPQVIYFLTSHHFHRRLRLH